MNLQNISANISHSEQIQNIHLKLYFQQSLPFIWNIAMKLRAIFMCNFCIAYCPQNSALPFHCMGLWLGNSCSGQDYISQHSLHLGEPRSPVLTNGMQAEVICTAFISQLKKKVGLAVSHDFYQLDSNKALKGSQKSESLHGREPYASQNHFPGLPYEREY